MIQIYQAKSKPGKKKPGWREAEAKHAAWLSRVQGMSLGISKPKAKTNKRIDPVVPNAPVVSKDRLCKLPSLMTMGGAATKPVARPDILYREDPEMLKRELTARLRKFNVAPAYNKGGDVYVTEEELANQLRGNKRRS